MESCFFSAQIEPARNGIENVYRSWATPNGSEEQRRTGLNGPVSIRHGELDSRSAVTSSYSYTCPQSVNNLSLRKDENTSCGDYFSNSSQHLFGLPRPALPVGGKAPAVLSANLPHQPAASSQTLHRPTPASVHASAFTQSVPRSPTKWPPPGTTVPHYNGQSETEPNATAHAHRSQCTGEWQCTAHQAGYPTYHQLNTSGCLGSFGAPPSDHYACATGTSSSLDEVHRGREGGGYTMSTSPCAACGDILCPKSHPMYPTELNAPCPRSPTQSAVAIRPCSSLSFPTYAAGPPPAIGAAESDALVRYRWPATAPVYFYSKLVSAGKPDGIGGVGVGAGGNSSSAGATPGNVDRASKPRKQPSNYRSKGTNLCNVCGKSYARPSTLKTHLRTHSGEKPYRCPTCNKAFSQTANLTAHMRTHSGEKPFQCAVCHRQFSQSSSVTTHMRTHSGERPYRCAYCKKAFADSSTLTKHLRIHSGEKPYQCSMCLLRFSQSGNLTRHMKIHQHI